MGIENLTDFETSSQAKLLSTVLSRRSSSCPQTCYPERRRLVYIKTDHGVSRLDKTSGILWPDRASLKCTCMRALCVTAALCTAVLRYYSRVRSSPLRASFSTKYTTTRSFASDGSRQTHVQGISLRLAHVSRIDPVGVNGRHPPTTCRRMQQKRGANLSNASRHAALIHTKPALAQPGAGNAQAFDADTFCLFKPIGFLSQTGDFLCRRWDTIHKRVLRRPRGETTDEQRKGGLVVRSCQRVCVRACVFSHHHVPKGRLGRPVGRHVFVVFAHPVRARLLAKHHPMDPLGQLNLSTSDFGNTRTRRKNGGAREQEQLEVGVVVGVTFT